MRYPIPYATMRADLLAEPIYMTVIAVIYLCYMFGCFFLLYLEVAESVVSCIAYHHFQAAFVTIHVSL